MATLTDLLGNPISWPELLRRNEAWHAARVSVEVPVASCYVCRVSRHRHCGGRARANGAAVRCECYVNGHAA